MGRLKGKVAIVTGAGQGVGYGVARALAREGAKVVCANRNAEKGEAVVASIREDFAESGGEALYRQTDVSQRESVLGLVDVTLDALLAERHFAIRIDDRCRDERLHERELLRFVLGDAGRLSPYEGSELGPHHYHGLPQWYQRPQVHGDVQRVEGGGAITDADGGSGVGPVRDHLQRSVPLRGDALLGGV